VLAQLGGEVHIGEDVAVEHEEALVEQLLGVLERAAGPQRRRLFDVAQPDAHRGPVAEHRAHPVGHEPAGEDDVVDAVPTQPLDHVGDERAVHQGHDRLGHGGGERPQPRPLPAGEDQRLHKALG
jgi:hypothetical protein